MPGRGSTFVAVFWRMPLTLTVMVPLSTVVSTVSHSPMGFSETGAIFFDEDIVIFGARGGAGGVGGHLEIALVEEIADVAGLALDLDGARPDDVGAGDADEDSAIAFGDVALFDGEDEIRESFLAAEIAGDEVFDLGFSGEVEDAVLDGPDVFELGLIAGFGFGADPDPAIEVFAVEELDGVLSFPESVGAVVISPAKGPGAARRE